MKTVFIPKCDNCGKEMDLIENLTPDNRYQVWQCKNKKCVLNVFQIPFKRQKKDN